MIYLILLQIRSDVHIDILHCIFGIFYLLEFCDKLSHARRRLALVLEPGKKSARDFERIEDALMLDLAGGSSGSRGNDQRWNSLGIRRPWRGNLKTKKKTEN